MHLIFNLYRRYINANSYCKLSVENNVWINNRYKDIRIKQEVYLDGITIIFLETYDVELSE